MSGRRLSLALLTVALASAQSWIPQTSGTGASFRGIHAADAQIVWVSGTAGTYVTTADGGASWHAAQVPGAEKFDFRAVWAFDAKTAYLLSIGTGDQSRIYQTRMPALTGSFSSRIPMLKASSTASHFGTAAMASWRATP